MKKLSKTEKIKRLRVIKKVLKKKDTYMCFMYADRYDGVLFSDIPELYRYRPKQSMIGCGVNEAWTYDHLRIPDEEGKIKAIDKAIKLIQSK